MRPSRAALDPLAVCGDLWRIMHRETKLAPKAKAERSTPPGDAYDPPGPLLMRGGGLCLDDGLLVRRPSCRANKHSELTAGTGRSSTIAT